MKKYIILSLTAALILTLTACISKPAETHVKENENTSSLKTSAPDTEISSAPADSDQNHIEEDFETTVLQTCTVDNITFSVDASWQLQSGMEGTFLVPNEAYVYQLQGISPLWDYTPQDFFDSLVASYENEFEIISTDTALSTYTSPDNVECYLGNIKMLMDYTYFDIDVLIAPQKIR